MRLREVLQKLPLVKQRNSGVCWGVLSNCGSNQKESPALFQGRSLVEPGNFYIPFLIAFPPVGSKYFHCPVLIAGYRVYVSGGTGTNPREEKNEQAPYHFKQLPRPRLPPVLPVPPVLPEGGVVAGNPPDEPGSTSALEPAPSNAPMSYPASPARALPV